MNTRSDTVSPPASRRGRGGMPRGLRHAQLLSVAEAIVLREGVAALTTSRLAAEAGIARTIVYAHFENASSVLLAVVERHWAVIDEQFESVRGVEPFNDRLRHVARIYLGMSAPDRLELRRLLDTALRDEVVNAAFQRRQQIRRMAWARRIESEFGLSAAAADFAALALLETLSALGSVLYDDPDARDRAVEMFVRGILGLVRGLADGTAAP